MTHGFDYNVAGKLGRFGKIAALDLRPVSVAITDEACPVAIGHGGR